MGRSPCCDKVGLKKGTWTSEEDRKLFNYIQQHGHGSWRSLPVKAGLERCGKSCRLRWTNYLRPDIKRGQFSSEEEKTVIQLHALLGNRWSSIAAHLPKRTDNEIKNYWNTHLKKRLIKMGIDPTTHKPKSSSSLSSTQQKRTANLSHMAQWETARLEAEARLSRGDSKLTSLQHKPTIFPPLPCLDAQKVWQGKCTASKTFLPNLNFVDNIRTDHQPSFTPNSQRFPVMSDYENSKSSQEIIPRNDDEDLKCIVKKNDEHFHEHPEFNFMEEIASVLPGHDDEGEAKYWDTILDDSSSSFAYGSITF